MIRTFLASLLVAFFAVSALAENKALLVHDDGDEVRSAVVGELGIAAQGSGVAGALNLEALKKFSAIILATTDSSFRRSFEQGLQKYVSGGGRLVFVHSAGDSLFKEKSYQQLAGGLFG